MSVKRAGVAIIGLSLILIVVGCFPAQMYQQKIFRYSYSEEPVQRLQVYSGITSLKTITINE